jgi:hypothetical protein
MTTLPANIPTAITDSMIPSVLASVKARIMGVISVCIKAIKKHTSAISTTKLLTPLSEVILLIPSLNSLKKLKLSLAGLTDWILFRTDIIVKTVIKNVAMSIIKIALISVTERINPAKNGDTRYLEFPAICTKPLALAYSSSESKSVTVAHIGWFKQRYKNRAYGNANEYSTTPVWPACIELI